MIKTLSFGEKDVQFSTSFAWTFIYKSQFGKDPASLLVPVIRQINGGTDTGDTSADDTGARDMGYVAYEHLGFTGITEIAWAMARLVDSSIPEPMKWIESFGDDFPAGDLVDEIVPEAIVSCFATKKSTAPIPPEKTEPKPKETTAQE